MQPYFTYVICMDIQIFIQSDSNRILLTNSNKLFFIEAGNITNSQPPIKIPTARFINNMKRILITKHSQNYFVFFFKNIKY